MINKTMQDELAKMTIEELKELNGVVVELVKSKRRVEASIKKATLRVGDKVCWTGRKGYQEGTLKKINRTRCEVQIGFSTWTVPISMLSVMEEPQEFDPLTGEWA